ncbi:hypothetical protein Hdeb2414_s0028g00701851 [Helianthus debilis subsp. tardiflorus]
MNMNGSFGLYSFLTGHMYFLCSVYYFIINKNQTRVLFFFLLLFMLILKTLLNVLDSLIPVDFKKSRMYIHERGIGTGTENTDTKILQN